jgi:phosphatidate cytidylyltransferase
MLAKRVLVAVVLLPIGIFAIVYGGAVFASLVVLILGLAAWEYVNLFRAGGLQPAGVILILGTIAFAIGRTLDGFESAPWLVSLTILVCMAYHLIAFERGSEQSGTDFGITLGGIFYLGWIGAYLISLRDLPDGMWWVLLVLPAVWLADSGAYFIGKGIGRHHITPRLSPKKTWEGYLGGILIGTLGTALLAFILSALTILGDLGESMFKRQVGIKDSSNLIPGHGGVFDRIDSWLWAGVIGYYVILWGFY